MANENRLSLLIDTEINKSPLYEAIEFSNKMKSGMSSVEETTSGVSEAMSRVDNSTIGVSEAINNAKDGTGTLNETIDAVSESAEKAAENTGKIGEETEKSSEKARGLKGVFESVGSSIKNSLSTMLGFEEGMAVQEGAEKIKDLMVDSVKLALELHDSQSKLMIMLKNTTNLSNKEIKDQVDALTEYDETLEKNGIISKSIILSGQQELAMYGMKSDQIKQLSSGLSDLIAQQKGVNATQEDAKSFADALGKAMEGDVGSLTRMKIVLTPAQQALMKHADATGRLAILSDVLKQKVGGVNEALSETPEGKIEKVKNEWESMKEEIGTSLIPVVMSFTGIIEKAMPVIQGVFQGISGTIMFIENHKKDMIALGITLAAIYSVINYEGIISGIGTIISLTRKWTAVQTYLDIVMDANPIAVIAIGIGAAALLTYELIAHWKTVFGWIEKAVDALETFFHIKNKDNGHGFTDSSDPTSSSYNPADTSKIQPTSGAKNVTYAPTTHIVINAKDQVVDESHIRKVIQDENNKHAQVVMNGAY